MIGTVQVYLGLGPGSAVSIAAGCDATTPFRIDFTLVRSRSTRQARERAIGFDELEVGFSRSMALLRCRSGPESQ